MSAWIRRSLRRSLKKINEGYKIKKKNEGKLMGLKKHV